ncbi:MAG: DNA polymerase III subunit beta [Candidatus Auribacterota bacterium]|nr:DNA polymerase III subunit beta [Candidatus Auribacterota bacterium]
MKLKFTKEDALYVMQMLQGVVGSRNMLPILSHVILETTPSGAKMLASDLEIWMSCPLPAEVEEEGANSIPGRRFFGIIRELPDGICELKSGEGNETTITAPGAYFRMKGLPREEFPASPDLGESVDITIRQAELKSLIRQTSYAISQDETRYVLNGLYFLFENGELTVVASDGRRLALAQTECPVSEEFRREIIIPNKTVQELGRILEDEGECTIKLGDRQVAFELPGVYMISRLVEGRFPNYQQVIPQQEGVTLTLPRQEFMQVVRLASLITDEKSNSVRFTFGNGVAKLSAVTPDVGETEDEIPIDYDGEELNIAFNPFFIIDVLKALEGEDEIKLQLIDSDSPGVFKKDERFLCVIMPMKL